MTGPEDHSNTRPISVAELLAKNGTIGAPPVGGRRRRRRGNTDSVTVAELTGEIPIVTTRDVAPTREAETDIHSAVTDEQLDEHVAANGVVENAEPAEDVDAQEKAGSAVDLDRGAEDAEEAEKAEEAESADSADLDADTGGRDADEAVEPTDEADEPADDHDDDYADAVADYAAHIEQREADPDPLDFFAPPPRRPQFGRAARSFVAPAGSGAEQMSPDPVDDGDLDETPLDIDEAPDIEDIDTEAALTTDGDEPPRSYLRSTQGPLFGGQTVADDIARRGARPGPEDLDLDEDETDVAEPRSAMSSFVRGTWVVVQCVIAVGFGAGLFVAFDQLWKWNNIVALVLSVLVILGLVVGVRVVRKTEDIGSTLIAVAVGALVTLGPLALLQSG